MLAALAEGSEGATLWHGLDIKPSDQHVTKRRFSAIIQGSSDLHDQLQGAGVDTLIVLGTATNVCCESTARDAFMLNYRTVVVSDANATISDEAHNAALSALMIQFSDIFTTDETIELLNFLRRARRKDEPVEESHSGHEAYCFVSFALPGAAPVAQKVSNLQLMRLPKLPTSPSQLARNRDAGL